VALKKWKQSLVSLVQYNKKKQIKKMSLRKIVAVHLRKVCYLKHQTLCITNYYLFNTCIKTTFFLQVGSLHTPRQRVFNLTFKKMLYTQKLCT
jgi:hypothetical protein